MRVPLVATRDMIYATRRLKADDEFEASRNDARVLTALGRARLATSTPESRAGGTEPDSPRKAEEGRGDARAADLAAAEKTAVETEAIAKQPTRKTTARRKSTRRAKAKD